MKKLLITGASGFIGRHICRIASAKWQVLGLLKTHPITTPGVLSQQLDLTHLSDVTALFKEFGPDAVIHTAAASSLGKCQKHPEETFNINVTASEHIALLCSEVGIPCVFTSTDIVFDGTQPPYLETDTVSPINAYGEQKALAEKAMMAAYENVMVCRLSLIFGLPTSGSSHIWPDGQAFAAGKPIRLFEDEFRTPLRVERAVAGLFTALSQPGGIIHLGGRERISRYEFGLKIAKAFRYTKAQIRSSCQKDIDLGAPRPPDVSLDISKAINIGFSPLPLNEELSDMVPRIITEKS
jgi:dTDP-4-dehydrorhamnose reductase